MPFCGRASRRLRAGARPSLFASLTIAIAIAAFSATAAAKSAVAVPKSTPAVIRITDDRGGNIGVYWARYTAIRDSKDQVIIDGTCSSACTLVLGIVPARRICVTKNARFGFHAAWRPGFLGLHVTNGPGTRTLMSFYPAPIQQWITGNGGLGRRTIYLSGPDLMGLYRQCK